VLSIDHHGAGLEQLSQRHLDRGISGLGGSSDFKRRRRAAGFVGLSTPTLRS
jgi:hypothetical protein